MSRNNSDYETNFPNIEARNTPATKKSLSPPKTRSGRKFMSSCNYVSDLVSQKDITTLIKSYRASLPRPPLSSSKDTDFDSANTSPERPLKDKHSPLKKKPITDSDAKKSLLEELSQPFPTYSEFCSQTKQNLSQASNVILFNTLSIIEGDKGRCSKGSLDKIMHCIATMQKYIMIAEQEIINNRNPVPNQYFPERKLSENHDYYKQTSPYHHPPPTSFSPTTSHPSYRDITEKNLQGLLQGSQSRSVPCKGLFKTVHNQGSISQSWKKTVKVLQPRNDDNTIIINDKIDNLTMELQKKVHPSDLKVPVKRILTSRRGKTIIEVVNKEQLPILKEEILKFFPNADIDKPRKRKPQITISNLQHDIGIENIITDLFRLNPTLNENSFARVLSLRESGEGQVCTLECDPKLFEDIIKLGKLYIGWNRCRIKENIYIPRCHQCQELGHVKKNCSQKDKRCANCGTTHKETKCDRPTKCYNCAVNNRKSLTKFNHEHPSSDLKCPCISLRESFIRSITAYV